MDEWFHPTFLDLWLLAHARIKVNTCCCGVTTHNLLHKHQVGCYDDISLHIQDVSWMAIFQNVSSKYRALFIISISVQISMSE